MAQCPLRFGEALGKNVHAENLGDRGERDQLERRAHGRHRTRDVNAAIHLDDEIHHGAKKSTMKGPSTTCRRKRTPSFSPTATRRRGRYAFEMSRAMKVAFIVASWTIAVVGCKSSDDCGQPDHLVINCAPQSSDLPGCPADGLDATYPEGCEEIQPSCLAAYPGPTKCYCNKIPNGGNDPDASYTFKFSCPI